MLGKTYTLEQILEAQQMLVTARQELDDEQQEIAIKLKELIIQQWDNNLHLAELEAIFNEDPTFPFPLPPDDVFDELKNRNSDLEFTSTDEPKQLTVTLPAK